MLCVQGGPHTSQQCQSWVLSLSTPEQPHEAAEALWPAALAALLLASCLLPCLASALCCSPLASAAGNFPGVTSLLREQHSSRTAISYNPNKRPCVLVWLLFKSREGADRWRPKLHKCLTEVSTQGQFLHCIKPGSHVDRHLTGAATFLGGGRLPRPLKKCFLEHVIWAVFPMHGHLAEGQHRYPAVRLLHPVPPRQLRVVHGYEWPHISGCSGYSPKNRKKNTTSKVTTR